MSLRPLGMTNLYNILKGMLAQKKLMANSSWIPRGPENNLADIFAR